MWMLQAEHARGMFLCWFKYIQAIVHLFNKKIVDIFLSIIDPHMLLDEIFFVYESLKFIYRHTDCLSQVCLVLLQWW